MYLYLKRLIALLIIAIAISAKAQNGLYNANGTLTVAKGALLHVDGEILNADTGVLLNDGVIELTGNLTNATTSINKEGSDATSTERAFKFIGTGTQTIAGNLADTTNRHFYNLIIDKGISAGIVQLETDIAIMGSAVFGSANTAATYTPTAFSTATNNNGLGLVRTFDNTYTEHNALIYNSAPNSVSGNSIITTANTAPDGYFQSSGASGNAGGITRAVSQLNTDYLFPVGTPAAGYSPATLNFSKLGQVPDMVQGMYVDASGGIGALGSSCINCTPQLQGLDGYRQFFEMDPCGGEGDESIILNDLSLNRGYWSFSGHHDDVYVIEVYTPLNEDETEGLRVIKKAGLLEAVPVGDWTPEIISGTIPDDVIAYSTGSPCYNGHGIPGGKYTGFGQYQVASQMQFNAHVALPVKLMYLHAQPVNNSAIRLSWATALEVNNRGFAIMRSTDGVHYKRIGWVDAAGNGNNTSLTAYLWDDTQVQEGTVYYYRLHQTDNDGAIHETQTVQAQLTAQSAVTIGTAYPNPASTITQVLITAAESAEATIKVFDVNGKCLVSYNENMPTGKTRLDIYTANLAPGAYTLAITVANQAYNQPLYIIK